MYFGSPQYKHFDPTQCEHFGSAQCKQKGFAPLFIIIAILIITGIAGGAYYFGLISKDKQPQQQNKNQISQSSPLVVTESVVPSPTPTTDKNTFSPPKEWKKFISNAFKLSFYYHPDFKVVESDKESRSIVLTQPDSPAKWSLVEYSDYGGGSRREWYLKQHTEFSEEDKNNLQFTELQLVNSSGLLITYHGDSSSWGDTLLVVRGKNILVATANSGNINQQFFKSIKLE